MGRRPEEQNTRIEFKISLQYPKATWQYLFFKKGPCRGLKRPIVSSLDHGEGCCGLHFSPIFYAEVHGGLGEIKLS
jgi:hypothetical protein